MRISQLTVTNFKGFAEQKFEFDPELNLLIGENGSGKSSALQAVSLALAQLLTLIVNDAGGGLHASQIRHVRQSADDSVRFEPQYPFKLTWRGQLTGQPIYGQANVSSETNLNGWASSVQDPWYALAVQMDHLKAQVDVALPLLAFYRANRFALPSVPTMQWQSVMTSKPRRTDGYTQCLEASAQNQTLLAWLAREQLISLQDGKPTKLFQAVERAVCLCLPEAESLSFNVRESQPVIRMSGAKDLLLSDLSDGQRSLLAMTADIAIRAAQLNPQLGDGLLAECPGIVLIDEIDLHLHPRWQRQIIGDLRRTFPKVQFIVTTHSPQIIGEVPPEQIISLSLDGNKRVDQSYGLDTNEVLEQVMNATTRNTQVDRDLSRINDLIEADELDEAKKQIARLLARQNGPTKETVRAQSLVDRIEALADEMEGAS